MAISSIEHKGSWYNIYDSYGNRSKTIPDSVGELLGWSDRFFIIARNSWYETYDEQGTRIKIMPDSIGSFVSITGDQFIVRRGTWLDTYDCFGRKQGTRPVR